MRGQSEPVEDCAQAANKTMKHHQYTDEAGWGRVFKAALWPLLFVAAIWAVFWYDLQQGVNLVEYGVFPRTGQGALGILTSAFVHGDLNHIINNSIPLFVLGWCMFYFYPEVAGKSMLLIWLMAGVWLWIAAREAWHIGASGVVYGQFTFVFTSGIIRKNTRLMAISIFVAFLYGSMVWGILPIDYRISWEGHLWGSVAGIILAIHYRKIGTQRQVYQWEIDELLEEEQEEDDPINITYTYKEKEEEG